MGWLIGFCAVPGTVPGTARPVQVPGTLPVVCQYVVWCGVWCGVGLLENQKPGKQNLNKTKTKKCSAKYGGDTLTPWQSDQ